MDRWHGWETRYWGVSDSTTQRSLKVTEVKSKSYFGLQLVYLLLIYAPDAQASMPQ